MARVIIDKPVIGTTINTAAENARFAAMSGLSVNRSNVALNAIEHRHMINQAQVIGADTVRYSGAGTQTILNFGNMYPGSYPYDGRQPVTQTLKMFAAPWVAKQGDLLRVMMDIQIVEFSGAPFQPYPLLYSAANFVWVAQPYLIVGGAFVPIGNDSPHGSYIGSGGGPILTSIWDLDHTVPISQASYDTDITTASAVAQTTEDDRFMFSHDYVLPADVNIQGMQVLASGPYRIRWDATTSTVDLEPWNGTEDMVLGEQAFSMLLLRR